MEQKKNWVVSTDRTIITRAWTFVITWQTPIWLGNRYEYIERNDTYPTSCYCCIFHLKQRHKIGSDFFIHNEMFHTVNFTSFYYNHIQNASCVKKINNKTKTENKHMNIYWHRILSSMYTLSCVKKWQCVRNSDFPKCFEYSHFKVVAKSYSAPVIFKQSFHFSKTLFCWEQVFCSNCGKPVP